MQELIPIVAVVAPFALVGMILSLRHKAKTRELEHAEKMKALELGLPGVLGGSANWPAIVAIVIGAAMPASLFLFAWLASMTAHAGPEVWVTSMFVGGAGVIGGLRLGNRIMKEREAATAALAARQDEARYASNGHRKPSFDPDAYDAIAHRG